MPVASHASFIPHQDLEQRLARYGLDSVQCSMIAKALESFHCTDSCGRQRRCLDHLCKAASAGDQLAMTLLTVQHHDRLMDMAALAYGRWLSGDPLLCRPTEEDTATSRSPR